MAQSSLSLLERFWSKVQITSECWPWLGARDVDGYGGFKKDGEWRRAHVVSYESAYSVVPEGMWVLHHCDNPPCVKPSHLFLGTNKENVADRIRRGRGACGERNGCVKMTVEKVVAMRALHATGKVTFAHLSKLFGISDVNAARICRRQTWKHVG